jgi:pantothenate kinase-related protein Tda10
VFLKFDSRRLGLARQNHTALKPGARGKPGGHEITVLKADGIFKRKV